MLVNLLVLGAQCEDIHVKRLIGDINSILVRNLSGCEFGYSQLGEIESFFEKIYVNSQENNDERFCFDKSNMIGTFTLNDGMTLKFEVLFKHQLNYESCGYFYDKIHYEYHVMNSDLDSSEVKKGKILRELHEFLKKYDIN